MEKLSLIEKEVLILLEKSKSVEEIQKEKNISFFEARKIIKGLLKRKLINKSSGVPTKYKIRKGIEEKVKALKKRLDFGELEKNNFCEVCR